MLLRRYARTIPDGASIPDASPVELRLHADDSLIASTTVSGGLYTFQLNGNPGPHYTKVMHDAKTHIVSSKSVGVSGSTDVGNLSLYLRAFSDGYVAGQLNELAVSATGTTMTVQVATGAAIVRGILYDQSSIVNATIGAASVSPRIDRIVVEVVPAGGGQNIEGRARIIVKPGTPAATPVAPTLVTTATLWEMSLATVLVDPSVSVIATNKVTSTRVLSLPAMPDGTVTSAKLADGAVTSAKLGLGSVDTFAIAAGGVGTTNLAANSVTTVKVADAAVTDAKLALRYLQLTGGSMSGNLSMPFADAAIDLGSNAATLPRIDFHTHTTPKDHDARIYAYGGGATDGLGTIDFVAGAVLKNQIPFSLERATFMPGTAYVATGAQTNGIRLLVTMAVGALVSGVTYDISCTHFCTLRGTGAGATASLRCNINGGVQRSEEFQVTEFNPRGTQVTQSASVTGTGVTINVTGSVAYETGTSFDVRAGQITVIAIPR